jgi:uncharacterized protein
MKNLSISKLLLLTFIPALGMLFSFLFFTLLLRDSVPPLMGALFGIVLVMIPFEIGIIINTSKNEFGKYNLKSALQYTQKISKKQFIGSVAFSIAWTAIVFSILQKIEHDFMYRTIFNFIPEYFKLEDFPNQLSSYSISILKVTSVLTLVLNGLLAPIVEELYFRGYLLPRISIFGKYSPLIITVMFSLYHLFSPWENITRIIAMFPYNYFVWKYKNIYIGIITHCFMNTLSSVFIAVLIFNR